MLWLFVLYTPALEIIPLAGPVLAPHLPLAGGAIALAYSYFNAMYVPGYMESADGRLKPFYRRTACFRALIYVRLSPFTASMCRWEHQWH